MIATLASTEFLPTNTSAMDSPFMIVAFVLSGLIVIASIAFCILQWDESEAVYYVLIGVMIALALSGGAWAILSESAAKTNRNNLTENIKTVYDIENVMFEDEAAKDKKISEPSPLTVTVTKDGKAYKVILNQDKKTYEPNLSSFETDSIDIKMLKRAK